MDGLKRDRSFVGIVILVSLILAQVPQVVGRIDASRHPSMFFSGLMTTEGGDMNSYLAFMSQAKHGRWIFSNPFTPEPHAPALVNLQWLLIGKISAVLRFSPPMSFLLWRCLGSVFLLLAFWSLLGFFTAQAGVRRFAFVAYALGGGLGWLYPVISRLPGVRYLPLDLVSGLQPFVQSMSVPNGLLPHALLILAVIAAIRGLDRGDRRWGLKAGGFLVLSGLCRPFDMILGQLCFGLFALTSVPSWRKVCIGEILRYLIPVFCCIPVNLYMLYLFGFHPVFKWWTKQNDVPLPFVSEILLGMGLMAIPALLGLRHLRMAPLAPSPPRPLTHTNALLLGHGAGVSRVLIPHCDLLDPDS